MEILIDVLDLIGGDPDCEGQCDEDPITCAPELGPQFMPKGPGCAISDEAEQAYVEWHTRGRHKLALGGSEITAGHEDDEEDDAPEEDDPQGACDEDEVSTNGTGHGSFYSAIHYAGPGCAISDPDYGGEELGERDEINGII